MKFRTSLMTSLLIIVGFSKVASAQKKAPPTTFAQVSLVLLGPQPPKRYQKEAGRMLMLPPAPGEIPPSVLYYQVNEANTPHWKHLAIPYNTRPLTLQLPAPSSLALYKEKLPPSVPSAEQVTSSTHFLTLPSLKPEGAYLITILPRGKAIPAWSKKPRVRSLNLKSPAFAQADCILLNYSAHPLESLLGDQTASISSGGKRIYRNTNHEKYLRVAAKYTNHATWVANRTLILNTDQPNKLTQRKISLVIFYDAHPATNAGRDIGAFFTEIAYP